MSPTGFNPTNSHQEIVFIDLTEDDSSLPNHPIHEVDAAPDQMPSESDSLQVGSLSRPSPIQPSVSQPQRRRTARMSTAALDQPMRRRAETRRRHPIFSDLRALMDRLAQDPTRAVEIKRQVDAAVRALQRSYEEQLRLILRRLKEIQIEHQRCSTNRVTE